MTGSDSSFTLITGASSGIGRAMAEHLSAGRRLVIHGRNLERLEACRAACQYPERHVLWRHDLRDPSGIASSLQGIMQENAATIDCFIHSAAVLTIAPIRTISHTLFTEAMNANVISAAEIVSLLTKRRINQQALRNIVFISSIASNFGAPGFATYTASKSALDGLMRTLAVELAPQVRVNAILPGGIRTPMTDSLLEDQQVFNKFVHDYPLGIGQTSDIVAAAEFLLSDASRWITGQQMVVDGGRSINISI